MIGVLGIYLVLGAMAAIWFAIGLAECDNKYCEVEDHRLSVGEILLLVGLWPVWVVISAIDFWRTR